MIFLIDRKAEMCNELLFGPIRIRIRIIFEMEMLEIVVDDSLMLCLDQLIKLPHLNSKKNRNRNRTGPTSDPLLGLLIDEKSEL
jgi:hypothetical protein